MDSQRIPKLEAMEEEANHNKEVSSFPDHVMLHRKQYGMRQTNKFNGNTECGERAKINPVRRRGGAIITGNAARERTRVKTLRTAFAELQQALPCVPPDTKLSKLDVLVLATMYITQLMGTLQHESPVVSSKDGIRTKGHEKDLRCPEFFHPVKVGYVVCSLDMRRSRESDRNQAELITFQQCNYPKNAMQLYCMKKWQ